MTALPEHTPAGIAAQLKRILTPQSPPFVQSQALPLFGLLVDPVFLNGAKDQPSVWSELQSVCPPVTTMTPINLLTQIATSLTGVETPPALKDVYTQLLVATSAEQYRDQDLEVLDDGSLCLSCPLDATDASQVTLTPHTIELMEYVGGIKTSSWWDLPWRSGKTLKRRVIAKKIFYPPLNAVSVHVTWWGYEIFLPHTIMLNLGTEVAPYAAVLTSIAAAITYIVAHVPMALELLPGVAQLKAILPILGSICGFILWYWKTLKADDLGNGIILAATWLIPFAFIPRTLNPVDWPDHPPVDVKLLHLLVKQGRVDGLVRVADDKEVMVDEVTVDEEGQVDNVVALAVRQSKIIQAPSVFTEHLDSKLLPSRSLDDTPPPTPVIDPPTEDASILVVPAVVEVASGAGAGQGETRGRLGVAGLLGRLKKRSKSAA